MTENQYDPSKTFIGTRLIKDSNEAGSPIVDENTGEWKSGKILVNLYDIKTGNEIAGYTENVTRNKYIAWKEDFDVLNKEEVLEKYFKKVKTVESTQTDLQVEAERSTKESEARAKDLKIAELEAELARRDEIDGEEFTNVLPVGSPEVEASNPEQEFSAEQMIKKGADAAGTKGLDNPEQSAPNVPEDEFTKKKGNDDVASKTTEVKRDVKPVGSDATTNKEVVKTSK